MNEQENMTSEKRGFSAGKIRAYSILMIILLVAGTLLANTFKDKSQPFDLGTAYAVPAEEALARYEQEKSPESLADYVRTLCWHYRVNKEEDVKEEFLLRGEELLEMAKAGETDLEKLEDGEGTLLKVLTVLREEGVR